MRLRSANHFLALMIVVAIATMMGGRAFAAPASSQSATLPFIEVDVARRQVRVECQAVRVDSPLEFFCVAVGGPEHETVLRTPATPSNIHLALLMIGLEAGEPAHYSESAKKWLPPHGPPIHVSVEFQRGGAKTVVPAAKLVCSLDGRTPMPDRPFVFTGSRILEDGQYAGDVAGYIVSLVNFELTPLDVPQVASNSNETLEWRTNNDVAPPASAAVTMILEPAGAVGAGVAPAEGASVAETSPATTQKSQQPLSEVSIDQGKVDRLKSIWQDKVSPHGGAMRQAAQAQYDVIRQLRQEQQRLIDEADRVQRLIDELERQYQDLTVPRPTADAATQPARD